MYFPEKTEKCDDDESQDLQSTVDSDGEENILKSENDNVKYSEYFIDENVAKRPRLTATGMPDDDGGISVSSAGLSLDPNLQYQFRTDGGQGQVTYRVVQVAQNNLEATGVLTDAFNNTQVAQAVIPITNGGSPDTLGTETRFAYIPAVATGDVGMQDATISQVTAGDGSGQFYVMMSPQEVLQGQRTLAPRTHNIAPRIEATRSGRDERRRATHNEVERRRRDKINNWIVQLSKIVPDCQADGPKSSSLAGRKGEILERACKYIRSLQAANSQMADSIADVEKISLETELLRSQNEELKQENTILRAAMAQQGITIPDFIQNGS